MLQDLHDFIRQALKKKRSSFIPTEAITDAINAASKDLWKELILIFNKEGRLSPLLNPFKSSATITDAGDYTAANKGQSEVISAEIGNIPVFIARNDFEWANRALSNEYNPSVDHLFLKRKTYGTPSYDEVLPEDFTGHTGVFYITASGETYEGQILDSDEFLNRKNSSILAPSVSNPIATIYAGKLDVYPKTGATTIILPYVSKYFLRYQKSSTSMVFTLSPATITDDIDVYFIDQPVEAAHNSPSYTGGNPDALTVTTDLNWNNEAFGELATRALTYLGLSVQDQPTMQIEQIRNVNEIQSPNR